MMTDMDSTPDSSPTEGSGIATGVFEQLLIGLGKHLDSKDPSPLRNTLRHAMNTLAFKMGGGFPKTIFAFLAQCREPVGNWFPFPVPTDFNAQAPLVYDTLLSEEAQVYLLDLLEVMQLPLYPGQSHQKGLRDKMRGE